MSEIDNYYAVCPDCGGSLITLATDDSHLDEEAGRIAWAIFNNKDFPGDIMPDVAGRVAVVLRKALIEGYGADYADISLKSPDFAMLSNLERNVYSFSVAKNYHELKQATLLIKDGDRVRNYNEFKAEIIKLHNTFNKANLSTEYNTAVNSAELAARWSQFQQNKEAMPNLIYQTVGDSRVRDSHKALDGVKRPVDDDFWNTYYPPNGWNCRCTVNQTGSGEATPLSKVRYPEVIPMFRTNLAQSGLVFPKDHPYFTDNPSHLDKEAFRIRRKDAVESALKWMKENISENKATVLEIHLPQISKLHLRRKDIKTIVNKPHKHTVEIARIVSKLDLILDGSVYVDWSYDDGSHPGVIMWHYFELTIMGDKSWINVMQRDTGEFRVHYISDNFDPAKLIKSK